MESRKSHRMPVPHNGKKVNDWETLRHYVEEAQPPADAYIEGLSGHGGDFIPTESTGSVASARTNHKKN